MTHSTGENKRYIVGEDRQNGTVNVFRLNRFNKKFGSNCMLAKFT